ncbi:MAG: GNAT family N-acetyltransferase [Ktedonobacteraceae bacterium]|nr:GNAT family N-acetyltransferase [Ktedonobacteraceae bacterium]
MTVSLPTDLRLRFPSLEDAQEIAKLVAACEIADAGSSDADAETVRDMWSGLDLAHNAFVVVTEEGRVIGYTGIKLSGQMLILDPHTNIHPEYRGRDLESLLLQLAEKRGQVLLTEIGGKATPVIKTWSISPVRRQLLEQQGYVIKSSEVNMEIDLRDHPPTFCELPGLDICQAHLPQDEHAVHFVVQEAFQDIGGYPYRPFEEWRTGVLEVASFDPSMLYVAREGENIVGVIVCRTYLDAGNGFVHQVAVLRAYRQRGIAFGLLQRVFMEYAQRGISHVVLNVDEHNATGAHQLYASAGMRRSLQIDEMQKVLA